MSAVADTLGVPPVVDQQDDTDVARVRVTISVERAPAQRADEMARRSGTPRSRLDARTPEEYLTRQENEALVRDLNAANADFPDEEESATLQALRPPLDPGRG